MNNIISNLIKFHIVPYHPEHFNIEYILSAKYEEPTENVVFDKLKESLQSDINKDENGENIFSLNDFEKYVAFFPKVDSSKSLQSSEYMSIQRDLLDLDTKVDYVTYNYGIKQIDVAAFRMQYREVHERSEGKNLINIVRSAQNKCYGVIRKGKELKGFYKDTHISLIGYKMYNVHEINKEFTGTRRPTSEEMSSVTKSPNYYFELSLWGESSHVSKVAGIELIKEMTGNLLIFKKCESQEYRELYFTPDNK